MNFDKLLRSAEEKDRIKPALTNVTEYGERIEVSQPTSNKVDFGSMLQNAISKDKGITTPAIKTDLPTTLPKPLSRISPQGELTNEALKLRSLKSPLQQQEDIATMNVLPSAIGTGLLKAGESLVKSPAYAVAGIMTSEGDSKRYEEANKYVPSPSKLSASTLQSAQKIADATSKFNLYPEKVQNFMNKTQDTVSNFQTTGNRLLGQTAIAGGQMIPTMLTGGLAGAGAGLGVMGAGVYSQSMGEALKKGNDVKKSAGYALGQTAIELGTEKLFGGIPGLGKGIVSSVIGNKLAKSVGTSTASKLLASIGKSVVSKKALGVIGEGFEEVLAEYLSPIVERATIDPNASDATLAQMAESFVSGALLSTVLQGGSLVLSSGKTISKVEDIQTLNQEEKQEFNSILEQKAYESNVRKGKITPQGETINSYSSDSFADQFGLPKPKVQQGKVGASIKPNILPQKEFIDNSFNSQYNTNDEIKSQLSKYYVADKGGTIDVATQAVNDLKNKESEIYSSEGSVDRNTQNSLRIQGEYTGQGKLIGRSFSDELIESGKVNLTGRKFTNVRDLAVLSNAFRDPRFETFRVIYTKGDVDKEILGMDAVSSRLPNSAIAFVGNKHKYFSKFQNRMDRLGADGYYLLHNHPSGDPTPSQADKNLSAFFSMSVKGFREHIIINSNKYSRIYEPIPGQFHGGENLPLTLGKDILFEPSKPHPLIGEKISSPERLAELAKQNEIDKPNQSIVVFTGAKGTVTGILEIDNRFMNKNPIEFANFIRNRAVENNGVSAFLQVGKSADKNVTHDLFMNGVFTDVISESGDSIRQTTTPSPLGWMGSNTTEAKAFKIGTAKPKPFVMDKIPTKPLTRLLPKPTDIYSQAKGQREMPRAIFPAELPRFQPVAPTLPQPLPKAPLQAKIRPVQKSKAELGSELPKEQMFGKKADLKIDLPKKPKFDINTGLPLNNDNGEIAEVLTSSKQAQSTLKERVSDFGGELKRKFIDAGDTVSKIGKITKDKGLYHYYNNARQSRRRAEYMVGEAQTNLNGKTVGKSIKDIFTPIRNKGEDYYKAFTTYMLHEHNIDRMAQNKPVFGESVSAEMSRIEADKLLKQYPEFANFAQEIYNYNKNQMQYRIDSGLVSQEQAQIWEEMYPHYVPTFRANPKSKGIMTSKNMAAIEKTVKTAKGSNLPILPLHENMAKQTMQTVEAANKNIFGNRLIDNASDKTSRYIQDVQNIQEDIDLDTEIPELKNHFRVYKNGEAYQVVVDDTLFEGLKALSDTGSVQNAFIKGVTAGNQTFKQLITGWNPFFLVRNGARDIQDAGLYSKNLKEFAKKYPEAMKQMAENGEMWQQYKALGGAGSSFFDYLKGYKDDPSWIKRNTVDKVEQLNMAMEQLPRFAEFVATVTKGDGSYNNLMEAMYNSVDITVNFGRSGTWGKTLNSTFVPFFNPSVQGGDKLVRRFTETKGAKEWTELTIKAAALGILPSVINAMMYMGDPDYDELNDREKDINYLFKIGENQWIKIPKGRVLSLFGATAQRTMRALSGEKNAYKGLLKTMADQTAPISPTESNILSPLAAVKNNKSWYGGTIEPQRLEKFSPGKRYDETTTSLSKFIGEKIGYSPKKLDYLFDAYTGIIGDTVMPMLTPRAEANPLKKSFTIDGALSNKLSQQFYDLKDKIYYAKNDTPGKDKNDALNSYMNKQNGRVSDIYDTIRKTEGSSLSDKEKRAKVKELRIKVNDIYRQSLDYIRKNSEY